MPDTKVSALTDGTTANSTDRIPVARDAGGGTFNNRYVTPGYIGTTLLGSGTALTGSTVTTSSPVLNLTQTWNDGAGGTVTFTGLKFNATDTASASGSLLLDLQIGASSKFSVTKSGLATFTGAINVGGNINMTGGTAWIQGYNNGFYIAPDAVIANQGAYFGFAAANNSASNGADVFLRRAAAATLQLGAADTTGTTAPTPQFLRVQSWSSSTNNNQLGADFTIQGSRGTGTGAGGSIIFQVAPAGGSSNGVQNAYSTALTLNADTTSIFTNSVYVKYSGNNKMSLWPTLTIGLGLASDQSFAWSTTTSAGSSYDLFLFRDAANTLALRNGTNAQRFNVYNTYTSSTNYETFKIDWITTANTCLIGTEKGSGGGTARSLALQTNGTTRLTIAGTGASFVFASDAFITFSGKDAGLDSPSTGNFRFANELGNDFGRLQFGGTTSSYPALKRVSANLQVIAADGTSSAGLIVGNQALATTATDGFLYIPTCAGTPTGTPTTQTGTAPLVVDSTNNKLYVYVGGAWTAMN